MKSYALPISSPTIWHQLFGQRNRSAWTATKTTIAKLHGPCASILWTPTLPIPFTCQFMFSCWPFSMQTAAHHCPDTMSHCIALHTCFQRITQRFCLQLWALQLQVRINKLQWRNMSHQDGRIRVLYDQTRSPSKGHQQHPFFLFFLTPKLIPNHGSAE